MAERTHYIVRRMPSAYELHEAQERAATRRAVRDGVITALLVLATVAAILAAGPMPARGSTSIGPIQYRHGCTAPHHLRFACGPVQPKVVVPLLIARLTATDSTEPGP